jgi:beta-glucosidase
MLPIGRTGAQPGHDVDDRPELAGRLPASLVVGAATSAYQIEGAVGEGGRGASIWDEFVRRPGTIIGGDTGDVACDHYHRWSEDVDIMQSIGLEAYRFSIAWPRVVPEGSGPVNPAALDFYRRLVDALLEAGIEPCATLFHWDLPDRLQADARGFVSRDTAERFAEYAAVVAGALGDRVRSWSTFNEPWVHAYLGYASGQHAPGERDPAAALAAAHHQLLAHGLATHAIRAVCADPSIGIVLNMSNVRARDAAEVTAAGVQHVDGLLNRWWLDALARGSYPADVLDRLGPLAPTIEPGDSATIAAPIDWLGVNYYTDLSLRERLDGDRELATHPGAGRVTAMAPQPPTTDMGWEITPHGLTEILLRVTQEYPELGPISITENGAAYDDPVVDGRCHDERRISYLDAHLHAVCDAIDGGADVRRYFVWSLMDNFEWAYGYSKRFGLVHVDFATLRRTPRVSADWLRDLLAGRRSRI